MECYSFCIASKIDLDNIEAMLNEGMLYTIKKELSFVSFKNDSDELFFLFSNGTVIFWNMNLDQINKILKDIDSTLTNPLSKRVHHVISYSYSNNADISPNQSKNIDWLTLEQNDINAKESCSLALSQAIKLLYFENKLELIISTLTPHVTKLSHKGHMKLSRNKLRKITGEIMSAKSEMNLISNFMYKPRFVWQHPKLEEYYELVEDYMEIDKRINVINHRLNTLSEIFDMFNSYSENKHSHFLEVVIILLIGVEIIFDLLHFFI